MKPLPVFSMDLIKELDEAFPLRNPEPNATHTELMYRAGQRSVIEHLKLRVKTAEDDILNNND